MSTHALASLTATYTDSEPELDDDETSSPQEAEKELDKKSPDANTEKNGEPQLSNSINSTTASVPLVPAPPVSAPTLSAPAPALAPAPAPVPAAPVAPAPPAEVSSKVTQLVSYHDDNIISDDEGDYIYHRNDIDLYDDFENHIELLDGIELPPEPLGRCSPRLIEKVMKLHEKIESGLDMNNTIQSRKDFRNPSIYEKLIQFCGINELGTNYAASTYDPLKWGKESYYEELAQVQKIEMEKREKERKERTKVEFVSGTKRSSAASEEEMKKRKSKWDQVGAAAAAGSLPIGMIRPAGLLQPSLTTSVTGTKGTVISAFGSLPKKPRI